MSSFALGLSGIGIMFVLLFLRQPVWLALAVYALHLMRRPTNQA